MLVLWKCNSCDVESWLPEAPPPKCDLCERMMQRARRPSLDAPPVPTRRSSPRTGGDDGPPPPPPPRRGGGGNSGGPPPPPPPRGSSSGASAIAPISADAPPPPPPRIRQSQPGVFNQLPTNENPIHDFFNVYVPCKMRGEEPVVVSKAYDYIRMLVSMHDFLQRIKCEDHQGAMDAVLRYVSGYAANAAAMVPWGVCFSHCYSQSLDYRVYQNTQPGYGWCLGFAAYWLKHKRHGVNVFPNTAYSDAELGSEMGTPIRLMKNQAKMVQADGANVEIGAGNRALKNVLDYIAGGRHDNAAPVVKFDLTAEPGRIDAEIRKFMGVLSPNATPREARYRDLFIIGFTGDEGNHAMALDMRDLEFFDPNKGVISPSGGSREKLVHFLFRGFFPIFYPGKTISKFEIHRIT